MPIKLNKYIRKETGYKLEKLDFMRDTFKEVALQSSKSLTDAVLYNEQLHRIPSCSSMVHYLKSVLVPQVSCIHPAMAHEAATDFLHGKNTVWQSILPFWISLNTYITKYKWKDTVEGHDATFRFLMEHNYVHSQIEDRQTEKVTATWFKKMANNSNHDTTVALYAHCNREMWLQLGPSYFCVGEIDKLGMESATKYVAALPDVFLCDGLVLEPLKLVKGTLTTKKPSIAQTGTMLYTYKGGKSYSDVKYRTEGWFMLAREKNGFTHIIHLPNVGREDFIEKGMDIEVVCYRSARNNPTKPNLEAGSYLVYLVNFYKHGHKRAIIVGSSPFIAPNLV